jgi:hypothetical protein
VPSAALCPYGTLVLRVAEEVMQWNLPVSQLSQRYGFCHSDTARWGCSEEGVLYIWLKNIVSFLDNEDIVISLRGFIGNSLCLLLFRALLTPTQAVWVLWYLPVRSGRPICVSLYSGWTAEWQVRYWTSFLQNILKFFLNLNLRYALYSEKRGGGALIGYLACILRADMTLPIGTSAVTVFWRE